MSAVKSVCASLGVLLILFPLSVVTASAYDFYARNWPEGLHKRVHQYHLEEGHKHVDSGSYQSALNDAEFILSRFPNDPEGLQLIMRIALDGDPDDTAAMPYFETALNRYPQHGETWLLYGIYLHRLGRLKEAVEAYNSAIDREARLAESYYNLGLALLDLGRLKRANEAAQRAYGLGHPLPGLRKRLRAKNAWQPDQSGE